MFNSDLSLEMKKIRHWLIGQNRIAFVFLPNSSVWLGKTVIFSMHSYFLLPSYATAGKSYSTNTTKTLGKSSVRASAATEYSQDAFSLRCQHDIALSAFVFHFHQWVGWTPSMLMGLWSALSLLYLAAADSFFVCISDFLQPFQKPASPPHFLFLNPA